MAKTGEGRETTQRSNAQLLDKDGI